MPIPPSAPGASPYFKFKKSLPWTFFGGIIYEAGRVIHLFLLFYILDRTTYAIVGTLFSTIYLAMRCADFGATPSLPPFFPLFGKNIKTCKKLFLHYLIIPFCITIPITVITSIILFHHFFPPAPTCSLFFLAALIITETFRSFFRLFLHATFANKITVSIELISFGFYLFVCWAPVFIFNNTPTIMSLFIPFLGDSCITLIAFIILTVRFTKRLPSGPVSSATSHQSHEFTFPFKRIWYARIINYFLRVSRDLFTSNFLTPFFAIKFGYTHAGLFFIAGAIVTAFHATIKGVILYSGNALFANIKENSLSEKKQAFSLLCQKFSLICLPIFIFFIIYGKSFISGINNLTYPYSTISIISIFIVLFLIIAIAELYLLIYEQFYIIQESPLRLLLFKTLEFALFYLLITSHTNFSPVITLLMIIVIKILSFTIIALSAYSQWKITPSFYTPWWYIALWVVVILLSTIF